MLKRFSFIFAYILLVIMPIQSMAAANMLVCNSVMQSTKTTQAMPCHEATVDKNAATEHHHSQQHQNSCKTNCGMLCASLCAMTALPHDIHSTQVNDTSLASTFFVQSYTSITLASLQRPPIFLS